MKALLV
jgi:hypothetical protein